MLIALDMDGVIADFISGLFQTYNWRVPQERDLRHEDHKSYNLNAAWGPVIAEKLVEIMGEPGFFAGLPLYEGAKEAVAALEALGHDIEICTSPPYRQGRLRALDAHAASDKIGWLIRHFPNLAGDVTLTLKKHLLRADVLIDDCEENIRKWCALHQEGMGYMVERPWNTGEDMLWNMRRGPLGGAPKCIATWGLK